MKQHIILKGAGKGSEMEARYTDDLDVTVGKLKVKWRFVAAEITDKVILGIDFLEHFKAIIDLGNYTVQINQDLIPAICLGNKEGKISHVYRVTVGRKTVVPPQSMKVLKIEIDRTPNSDIIIQPNYELKGLLTPNVVLKIGQEVSTVVRNGSNKFVTLKGGLKFGIGTEIECTIPLTDVNELDRFSDKSLNNFEPYFVTHQAAEADRISDSLTTGSETNENSNMVPPAHTILSIKADNNHSQVSSQNLDKNMSDRVSVKQALSIKDMNELIPKHIQDLYSRTIKGMTLSESKDIAELLIQFQDVFAKGDMDLGLFKGEIKHRIHTGDATPVKHRLRRTPLKFEGEEQKHLQDMLDKGVIQPSISDWAACPVLVRKKDGSIRYCLDYRGLNKATTKDLFPIAKIETCLDTLRGSQYMSKIVNKDGISIDRKNIDTVQKWPVPKSKKELESFLGFANYHREHVSHYAALAAPLHVLTGGKEFKWESEHQDAFNSIKKALTTPPVLGYPDPNFPFILDTDASENTIGAELSQIQNGKCVTAVSTALEQGSQWQIFEEDVDFVVPLTARSVSCTSPVGIIGLTIRSIRNVTSDNNISIMGMPTSYSNDDLRQLQNQDKHLSTIIAWLNTELYSL
ncbi:Hypothetical predicted protein [Mytilus galloprovincialis]|uniref:Reverse transcriptase/retrotransposon-derived protein RNase H-like domain-containing protein n=1 Tax=Mytilus galloprovincialis TaxID=29158 RepID=A0A8B6GI39_MYTGA|nr:Hypothetical predicted protein [Mytilus galloprovincialis]